MGMSPLVWASSEGVIRLVAALEAEVFPITLVGAVLVPFFVVGAFAGAAGAGAGAGAIAWPPGGGADRTVPVVPSPSSFPIHLRREVGVWDSRGGGLSERQTHPRRRISTDNANRFAVRRSMLFCVLFLRLV